MAERLKGLLDGEMCVPQMRRLPGGETDVGLGVDLHGRRVALVCALNHPDANFLALLCAARAASDLGAASVGLVAPGLAQARDGTGEEVSSKLFTALLSPQIDWLVTVDSHGIHPQQTVYDVPMRVVQASAATDIAPLLARAIGEVMV